MDSAEIEDVPVETVKTGKNPNPRTSDTRRTRVGMLRYGELPPGAMGDVPSYQYCPPDLLLG